MDKKFIFVTGGVVSSLGKGLASASIGCLLESRGFTVNLLKFDPYLNVDPGTMSPYQHGEVYVTDDGAETDLDLGHYERYTHAELSRKNNLTTVPFIQTAGELKTKPTQHSVKELLEIGIQADILLCRADRFLSQEMKSKIALFCNVSEKAVITAKDLANVYEVPLVLAAEGL